MINVQNAKSAVRTTYVLVSLAILVSLSSMTSVVALMVRV